MAEQVLFDVIAVCLKIAGIACAQTIGDSSAEQLGPAKELWMVEVLNIVHGKDCWPAAVEIAQNRRRCIKNVRFAFHQLPNSAERDVASESIKAAAVKQEYSTRDSVPQWKKPIINLDQIKIIVFRKSGENMTILLSDKQVKLTTITDVCEPP